MMSNLCSDSITPPTIPEYVLRKLISHCVCNNTYIFVFDGKVYKNIYVVAMGISLGPVPYSQSSGWHTRRKIAWEPHFLLEGNVERAVHYRALRSSPYHIRCPPLLEVPRQALQRPVKLKYKGTTPFG